MITTAAELRTYSQNMRWQWPSIVIAAMLEVYYIVAVWRHEITSRVDFYHFSTCAVQDAILCGCANIFLGGRLRSSCGRLRKVCVFLIALNTVYLRSAAVLYCTAENRGLNRIRVKWVPHTDDVCESPWRWVFSDYLHSNSLRSR